MDWILKLLLYFVVSFVLFASTARAGDVVDSRIVNFSASAGLPSNEVKCSKYTATRDIQDLLDKNVLKVGIPKVKRPSYSIVYNPEDISGLFSNIKVTNENGQYYLTGMFKGVTTPHERLLPLDAERFMSGDMPQESILDKYCSYLVVKK